MEENKNNEKGFAEKIGNLLERTQTEIEELAVQFSLGKAEASDKFEEIKREFNSKTTHWKQSYEKFKSVNHDIYLKIRTRLEELQVQLNLGKAEGKEIFEKQKAQILKSLNELETEIKSSPEWNKYSEEFNEEMEKFKLKLEILSLKFKLKKFEIKDAFKSEMINAKTKISDIYHKAETKLQTDGRKHLSDFSKEVNNVYEHMKNAVKSL